MKPNVIKQATKQHKQHLILKADDIKEENIIEGKRTKIPPKIDKLEKSQKISVMVV